MGGLSKKDDRLRILSSENRGGKVQNRSTGNSI